MSATSQVVRREPGPEVEYTCNISLHQREVIILEEVLRRERLVQLMRRIEIDRRYSPSLPAMEDMVWKAPLYGNMPERRRKSKKKDERMCEGRGSKLGCACVMKY